MDYKKSLVNSLDKLNVKQDKHHKSKSMNQPKKSWWNSWYKPEYKSLTPEPFKKSNEKVELKSKKQLAEWPSDTTLTDKQDKDRNDRHRVVVDLLNGTKQLSSYFHQKYRLGEVLGDGAFGFVLTALSLDLRVPVAIKFIIKKRIPKDLWHDNLPVEIHLVSKLSHPNIIRYIEHIDEPEFILLVTELFGTEWDIQNPLLNPQKHIGLRENRKQKHQFDSKSECSPLFRLTEEQEKQIKRRVSFDLFECIDAHKYFPDSTLRSIMAQIAMAVKYLHSNGIVHRDLKDENVVIDEDYHVKLVDFGSAARIPTRKEDYFTKFNGTTNFASPEVTKGLPYRGPEAELWALGVLFYTIATGENPFQNRHEIMRCQVNYPSKMHPDCRNLISRLLVFNDKQRATIDEVLMHPYLADAIRK